MKISISNSVYLSFVIDFRILFYWFFLMLHILSAFALKEKKIQHFAFIGFWKFYQFSNVIIWKIGFCYRTDRIVDFNKIYMFQISYNIDEKRLDLSTPTALLVLNDKLENMKNILVKYKWYTFSFDKKVHNSINNEKTEYQKYISMKMCQLNIVFLIK